MPPSTSIILPPSFLPYNPSRFVSCVVIMCQHCQIPVPRPTSAVAPQQVAQWPCYHTPIQLNLLQPYLDAHQIERTPLTLLRVSGMAFELALTIGLGSLSHTGRTTQLALPSLSWSQTELWQRYQLVACMLSPISSELQAPVHLSPMGLIPKPQRPNKCRLIVDLSTPTGKRVYPVITVS